MERLGIQQGLAATSEQREEFGQLLTLSVKDEQQQQGLSNPVTNMTANIAKLHQAGVPYQNMLVVGLPDMAIIPAVKALLVGNEWALPLMTEFSKLYNASLWAAIKLQSGFHSQFFNPTDLLNQIAQSHQYVDESGRVWAFPHTQEACYSEPYREGMPVHSCDGYLFYNLKHPSNETHQVLADAIWSQVSPTLSFSS
ncbi:SGNH/GDSL hydrolase family protein [Dongshaea marina]|uniref:hypothetical protein n=1 Tax=Dongshaea marina TaxID=2047966 RepID=UPI000D3E60D6|nr:hypothetical protein [Dongshaea marina]